MIALTYFTTEWATPLSGPPLQKSTRLTALTNSTINYASKSMLKVKKFS